MVSVNGKIALVTGGGEGIGRGITMQLAEAGAQLVVGHESTPTAISRADSVVRKIRSLGCQATAVAVDVTCRVSIRSALDEILARMTKIDILVNNAGVMQQNVGMQTSDEDFDHCFAVNVKAAWCLSQEIIPHFLAGGEGRIVNIASGAGRRGLPDIPAYSASKAALINLTQSLAAALGDPTGSM